ncbi:MAG: peptidylprolyl isomerase [Prevotella sp.]|nr:peptidylprolyl isomerase [Prevotella sp.]
MTNLRNKKKWIAAAILFTVHCSLFTNRAAAQSDPVVMTVNGKPVTLSEFEYSYNKNNSEGVIDKKTVDEYVELFINYKLKVAAALDAKYDTLTSFKQEFAQYRDQQVLPAMVTDDDMLKEAHNIYDNTVKQIGPDGLIQTAHILLRLDQKASKEELDAAKVRIDSIYAALKNGADFAEMAKKVSQDPGSAQNGGLLPFVQRGQLVKEFEDAAFALKEGEMSPVVQSPYGYHIILMKGRKQMEPFEFHKENILKFMEQRGIRDRLAQARVDTLVSQSNGQLTQGDVMKQKADELSAVDSDMKNLIREYYEGLLLYEISNNLVWDKAAKDEAGLAQFFKQHKKKYAWDEPRFKGIAYHVKEQADVKGVQQCVKKLKFDQWNEALRTTFNGDSVIRIRVEKGIFKKGDNALVDSAVFKKDTTVTKLKDYPIDAVYGKVLKKGPEDYTDVRGQVVADYQDQLEREWVAELRKRYTFTVDENVLRQVKSEK